MGCKKSDPFLYSFYIYFAVADAAAAAAAASNSIFIAFQNEAIIRAILLYK